VGMSGSNSLRLDWCGHDAAQYSVLHWHYSRSLPAPPRVCIGVWEFNKFIGCVIFSRGAARNIGRPFGLDQTEISELTRVALSDHRAEVSKIVSVALKMIKKKEQGLKAVVSYADPARGHIGSIYQAGNWVYIGTTPETTEYIAPDGKRWHSRMISPSGQKKVFGKYRAVWRPSECVSIKCPGKFKYVYSFDAEISKLLELIRKPYPKRAPAEGPGCPAPVGGSTPTRTLQILP